MSRLGNSNGIDYFILREQHLEDTCHCVFNQFYNHEPATIALRPSPRRFRVFVRRVTEEAALGGLSVVGVEAETGELAGALLCDDYARSPASDIDFDCIAPIAAIFDRFHDDYAALGRSPRVGEVYHPFMSAVWPRFGGRGIYKEMLSHAFRIAKDRGFRKIVCELTSSTPQHVVPSHFGHEVLSTIRYSEFEFGGRHPFASVSAPERCLLTEYSLDS